MTSVVLLSVVGTMIVNSSIIFVQCPFVTVEVSVLCRQAVAYCPPYVRLLVSRKKLNVIVI